MDEFDIIDVGATARIKGVTTSAVYRAINEGRLPHVRILGRIGLRLADVEIWQPVAYRDRPGIKGKGGRPVGTALSDETRRKLSEAATKRWNR